MARGGSIEAFDRSAYRSTLEDGIAEILASSFFFCTAISMWARGWAWLYFVPFFVVLPVARRLKVRFTYPRIGYVEPHGETHRELFGGIFGYVVIVLAAGALALFAFGDIGNPDHWYRWAPALGAVLFCGGFHYAGQRSGLVRFHVYTVVALVLGTLLAVLDPPGWFTGLVLFLAAMGTIIAATGTIVFTRFVRHNPVELEEAPDPAAATSERQVGTRDAGP